MNKNSLSPTKIVLSGSYGTGNKGDEAQIPAILEALKDKIPNAKFTVFSDNPKQIAKHYRVKTIYCGTVKGLWRMLSTLFKGDVFILGGGSLLDDQILPRNIYESKNSPLLTKLRAFLRVPLWLSKIALAKMFGKPVILYGQGVGCIQHRLGKLLTKFFVNKVDLITVRDEMSKKMLESLGITKRIYVTADPAIMLSPMESDRIQKILLDEDIIKGKRPLVGITLRPWPDFVKYDAISKAADYLIAKLNAKIIFVPMHYGRDNEVLSAVLQMMQYKDNAKILIGEYTPQEILGIIGQMDLLIGMRLHSLIFASIMNVPMIGITYMNKGKCFMEMINQERRTITVEDITSADIITKIDEVLSNKEQIKDQLKINVDILREKALLNAELATSLIRKKSRIW